MLPRGKVVSNYTAASTAFFLQVAVVVYGAEPRVRFLLSRHSNSETLLREIVSTPFTDRPGSNIGVFGGGGGVYKQPFLPEMSMTLTVWIFIGRTL